MLSRRILRSKVMQMLFAGELDSAVKTSDLSKGLKTHIDKLIHLYSIYLLYIKNVAEYVNEYADQRAGKKLPTKEDLTVPRHIANNRLIQAMNEDAVLKNIWKKNKSEHYIDDNLVKKLFKDLERKTVYQDYNQMSKRGLDEDRHLLKQTVKKVLLKSDDLFQHLNEDFINVANDHSIICFLAQKVFESWDGETHRFIEDEKSRAEEYEFADELLGATLENQAEFDELIKPKLVNWEMDRVAVMDNILLRMALCELVHFPTIPVKVTINEYIDLAKLYSTPRSKDFVNGVIDKLMHELKRKGKIKKSGRGLVDN